MKTQCIVSLLIGIIFFPLIKAQEISHSKTYVEVPNVIRFDKSFDWLVDFSEIKNSVLFQDQVIIMGINGGFASINQDGFSYNKTLSKKLNTGLFTDFIIWNDTIVAEKFGELFYLDNDTLWQSFDPKIPVNILSTIG